MKKMLHWIGFHIGYWYARLFICPFPKRREAHLNKIKNLTDPELRDTIDRIISWRKRYPDKNYWEFI